MASHPDLDLARLIEQAAHWIQRVRRCRPEAKQGYINVAFVEDLRAAITSLGAGHDRLRELAHEEAIRRHIGYLNQSYVECEGSEHTSPISECPHPDCLLVRQGSAPSTQDGTPASER